MAGRYNSSYSGVSELLNAPFMVAEMRRRAEKGKEAAQATAPRDTGHFAESFSADSGAHGGTHSDRAYGRLTNDDPAAVSIEFGTSDTPAHRTLRRALDAMGD